ncbi:SipW-dependent-type signal peptide-containing protein [Halopenitus sp. H-Gu1]|uniref:SipW-dependent-type signal peptide-containing protein n=1 Tax=Halopenitus sp. H-Gu1 TaxID=3242697 RepID=UPI00359D2092
MRNDEQHGLSRRTVLAGLGTIGIGAAGAGMGTTAYLSDEETFTGNELVAGSLDLKLDWSEHYFDGSAGTEYGSYLGTEDDLGDRRGFPSSNPVFAVPQQNVDEFMQATSIEAYPDTNDDGVYSPPAGWDDPESDEYVCTLGADTSRDMDPREDGTGTGLRSENDDTWVDEADTYKPLVSLSDVKPCDFGELTLSYHLCDNPGYVWLNGELIENAQNGYSEPERERLEELYGDDLPEEGQLADHLFVRLWYDDGDNLLGTDETEIVTGSLRSVLELLGDGAGIPLDPTGDTGIVPNGDDDEEGVTLTDDDCHVEPGNPTCGEYGLLQAIRIESGDLPTAVGESKDYETAVGTVTITVTEMEGNDVREFDIDLDGFLASTIIVKGGPKANICRRIENDELQPVTAGEGLGAPLGAGKGGEERYGVSHIDVCYDAETPDPGDPGEPETKCFEPSTTHYVGLEWWLPCAVGNEVQTDTVDVDLGFYTEQCRHNESPGVENETDDVGDGNGGEDGESGTETEDGTKESDGGSGS